MATYSTWMTASRNMLTGNEREDLYFLARSQAHVENINFTGDFVSAAPNRDSPLADTGLIRFSTAARLKNCRQLPIGHCCLCPWWLV